MENQPIVDLVPVAEAVQPALEPKVVLAFAAGGVITAAAIVGVKKWKKRRAKLTVVDNVMELHPEN